MNDNTTSEKLDQLYASAGSKLRKSAGDFRERQKWVKAVDELTDGERIVYLIGILNQQVLNGGFEQYFDNRYAIFGYETADILDSIKATRTSSLLRKALGIVNIQKLHGDDYKEYVWETLIGEELIDQLEDLTDQYYDEDQVEDLELLTGNYLKK